MSERKTFELSIITTCYRDELIVETAFTDFLSRPF